MATATSNEAQIYAFFKAKGLSDAQIAGILGNWKEESGFSPTAYNAHENAHGLAQWEGGRLTSLQAYSSSHGMAYLTLDAQLAYAWHELTGPYSQVLQSIRGMNNPTDVATEIDAHYEVSDGSTRQARINYANEAYSTITGGKPLTGGGTSSGGGSGTASFVNATPPPYDPTALTLPLTATQRASMISWIITVWNSGTVNRGKLSATDLPKLSDADLVKEYSGIYQIVHVLPGLGGVVTGTVLGWTEALGKILAWLTNVKNWERIGLFALGAIVLLIASIEFFK